MNSSLRGKKKKPFWPHLPIITHCIENFSLHSWALRTRVIIKNRILSCQVSHDFNDNQSCPIYNHIFKRIEMNQPFLTSLYSLLLHLFFFSSSHLPLFSSSSHPSPSTSWKDQSQPGGYDCFLGHVHRRFHYSWQFNAPARCTIT